MPLMFVLAGISTCYALEKRTPGQYAKERFLKLFIPLVSGLLLLIPMQTYFAERFHNGYTGGYFAQYILFFTKPTDLTGYTGGFTPGHLWFILYLFIISLVALPIILLYKKGSHKLPVDRMTVPMLLPMFIISSVLYFVLNFGGKSMGYYFAYFLLGYFILTSESVQLKLTKNRWWLLIGLIIITIAKVIMQTVYQVRFSSVFGLFSDLNAWVGILAFLGLGRQYLNKVNRVTQYLAEASFPIYIFHQTILVAIAFYMFRRTDSVMLQVAGIIIGSFVVTLGVYEAFRRNFVTRFLFGIKKSAHSLSKGIKEAAR